MNWVKGRENGWNCYRCRGVTSHTPTIYDADWEGFETWIVGFQRRIHHGIARVASLTFLQCSMQRIQHAIESMMDIQLQTSTEETRTLLLSTILQRITRTRIGEYCYNLLCNTQDALWWLVKLFPIEEGSLLITVNNDDMQPIEVQMHSGLFRKEDSWKWGACLSTLFSFKYSVSPKRVVTI